MNENELEGGIELETTNEATLGVDGAWRSIWSLELPASSVVRGASGTCALAPSASSADQARARDRALAVPRTDYWEPKNRAECAEGPRPCPCLLQAPSVHRCVAAYRAIKLNFPDLEVWDLGESCALDVADKHGTTLEDVGAIMN